MVWLSAQRVARGRSVGCRVEKKGSYPPPPLPASLSVWSVPFPFISCSFVTISFFLGRGGGGGGSVGRSLERRSEIRSRGLEGLKITEVEDTAMPLPSNVLTFAA